MAEVSAIDFDGFALEELFHPAEKPSLLPPLSLNALHLREKSTIRKSDEDPLFQMRLASPMWNLLKVQQKSEEQVGKKLDAFEKETEQNLAYIEQLAKEKEVALQKEAEATQSKSTWSTIAVISQYISGIWLISTGAPIFIASGILGLGNRVIRDIRLKDTSFLDYALSWLTKSQELQASISQQINSAVLALQFGLTGAGAGYAWYTGTLSLAAIKELLMGSPLSILNTMVSVGSQVGVSYYENKIAELQAIMKENDAHSTLSHFDNQEETKNAIKMVESNSSQADNLRKMIQTLQVQPD